MPTVSISRFVAVLSLVTIMSVAKSPRGIEGAWSSCRMPLPPARALAGSGTGRVRSIRPSSAWANSS
jgi:hypothetical protein